MLDRWLNDAAQEEAALEKRASRQEMLQEMSMEDLLKLAMAPGDLQLPEPPPAVPPGTPPTPGAPPEMEEPMMDEGMPPEGGEMPASEMVAEDSTAPITEDVPPSPAQIGTMLGAATGTLLGMIGGIRAGIQAGGGPGGAVVGGVGGGLAGMAGGGALGGMAGGAAGMGMDAMGMGGPEAGPPAGGPPMAPAPGPSVPMAGQPAMGGIGMPAMPPGAGPAGPAPSKPKAKMSAPTPEAYKEMQEKVAAYAEQQGISFSEALVKAANGDMMEALQENAKKVQEAQDPKKPGAEKPDLKKEALGPVGAGALGLGAGVAGGAIGTLGTQRLLRERRESNIEDALQQMPGALGEFYAGNPERRDEVADYMSRMPAPRKAPLGSSVSATFAPVGDEALEYIERMKSELARAGEKTGAAEGERRSAFDAPGPVQESGRPTEAEALQNLANYQQYASEIGPGGRLLAAGLGSGLPMGVGGAVGGGLIGASHGGDLRSTLLGAGAGALTGLVGGTAGQGIRMHQMAGAHERGETPTKVPFGTPIKKDKADEEKTSTVHERLLAKGGWENHLPEAYQKLLTA